MATIENAKGRVTIMVNVELKPDKVEKFEKVFELGLAEARKEEGVVAWNIYKVLDKELHYVVIETYGSKEIFEAHVQREDAKANMAVLEECMVRPIMESITMVHEMFPAI